MEIWGAPALNGYYCKDFISRTTLIKLLLRNYKITPYAQPKIPWALTSWRRKPACQTLLKAMNITDPVARVASGLLKALANISSLIIRRPEAEREELKSYWK